MSPVMFKTSQLIGPLCYETGLEKKKKQKGTNLIFVLYWKIEIQKEGHKGKKDLHLVSGS